MTLLDAVTRMCGGCGQPFTESAELPPEQAGRCPRCHGRPPVLAVAGEDLRAGDAVAIGSDGTVVRHAHG